MTPTTMLKIWRLYHDDDRKPVQIYKMLERDVPLEDIKTVIYKRHGSELLQQKMYTRGKRARRAGHPLDAVDQLHLPPHIGCFWRAGWHDEDMGQL